MTLPLDDGDFLTGWIVADVYKQGGVTEYVYDNGVHLKVYQDGHLQATFPSGSVVKQLPGEDSTEVLNALRRFDVVDKAVDIVLDLYEPALRELS